MFEVLNAIQNNICIHNSFAFCDKDNLSHGKENRKENKKEIASNPYFRLT
jgi:hypothetical protein